MSYSSTLIVSCLIPPRHIGALHTYLTSFIHCTQPLLDINLKQTATVEEFDLKWDADELEGWIEKESTSQ